MFQDKYFYVSQQSIVIGYTIRSKIGKQSKAKYNMSNIIQSISTTNMHKLNKVKDI